MKKFWYILQLNVLLIKCVAEHLYNNVNYRSIIHIIDGIR